MKIRNENMYAFQKYSKLISDILQYYFKIEYFDMKSINNDINNVSS